jgi:UDP-3-O-[3-hydroxymyristoyl] glucosamine N-acyltransferase
MEVEEKIRLSALAHYLNGELLGNDIFVNNFSPVDEPKLGSVVFVNNKKYLGLINSERIHAVVAPRTLKIDTDKPLILVDDDPLIMSRMIDFFYPLKKKNGSISKDCYIGKDVIIGKDCTVEGFAFIDDGVVLGDGCSIGSGARIGCNVKLGNGVMINSNTVIYENSIICNNVVIHANCTIGGDGFGYVNLPDRHIKIRQVGNVIIEDDVEIGCNTTIDRATLGSTVIGAGTKIDNLVQIGHNCKIGKNCIIVSQTGISGSCKIGDYVIIAGQVGIADHVSIVGGTVILARSAVMSDIEKKGVYCGTPVTEAKQYMKNIAVFNRLYDIKKSIDKILEDK